MVVLISGLCACKDSMNVKIFSHLLNAQLYLDYCCTHIGFIQGPKRIHSTHD